MALLLGAVGSIYYSTTTSCSLEAFSNRGEIQNYAPVTISGPPRPTVLARANNISIVTVAPSRTIVASRKKRKRGRRPDAGDSGNDDDGPGDGGNWGGGGWRDEGDGEGRPRWANQNLWMWQLLCICSLFQAVHHMTTKQRGEPQQRRIFTFASTVHRLQHN